MKIRKSLIALLSFVVTCPATGQTRAFDEIKPERVAEIAGMLPVEATSCFGRPITDRAYWSSPSTIVRVADMTATAQEFRDTPFPAWNDDAYLDFSRTGERPKGQEMMTARSKRLGPLVLAECLENQGRYLPAIQVAMKGLVEQPTWTLPAHDRSLKNFRRTSYEIDLGSSVQAADLAQALWLLGDRVEAGLRAQVVAAIHERVLDPFRRSIDTGKGHWWLGSEKDRVKNNWNAVCLAASVQAALTIIPDRNERAIYATAGEHYIHYFLNGIRGSGFCDEGGGYWVYGFGLFCHLRETMYRQTSGKVDLFDLPRAREGALFGANYQLTDHLMPTFADSRNGARVDEGMLNYCAVAFGRGGDPAKARLWGPRLCTVLVEATPVADTKAEPAAAGADAALRSYFKDVGVLVCRPSPSGTSKLAVAIKAGGNSSHSHNDVGSFSLSLGAELPIGDPGGPSTYDAETFGPKRFERKLFNSYGHPVPVIDGKLQKDATRVRPKVLSTSFSDALDEITIDLAPAYDVPALKSATRTLRYSRTGAGEVTVRDAFSFDKPAAVETGLSTRGKIEALGGNRFRFSAGAERVIVEIRGADFGGPKIETFTELQATFSRLGVPTRSRLTQGVIEFVIRPE